MLKKVDDFQKTSASTVDRLHGLDLVRGLCAITVMLYHYFHVTKVGTFYSAGLYGVYMFFVLSGFSLYYVYGNHEITERGLRNFFVARFFRIAPLYVAVATVKFVQMGASPENAYRYLMNISLLFGLGNAGATSTVGGGWSIGIEVAFYLLFPFLLLFRSRGALAALFVVTLIMNHALADLTFDLSPDPNKHWSFYTQPLTFLCYFVGGMLLAEIGVPKIGGSQLIAALATVAAMVFMFTLPHLFGVSREDILVSWEAKLMIAGSLFVVAAGASLHLAGVAEKIATFLGDISYSLYLIHLLVLAEVSKFLPGIAAIPKIAISAGISIVAAKIIHKYFEMKMRDLQWRYRT
ncbi:acyltransferase [Rhizobium sp. S96]|uniref:acyltransferase family protein n=1 Tax=Rhizobium sp. S96 TaxID=3055140 RepID=UPI0025AA6845|nr:acyltransferase [Rhizobium sp. S96]MDM9621479.1 acyltransferase [Rhizobium sp. S96]